MKPWTKKQTVIAIAAVVLVIGVIALPSSLAQTLPARAAPRGFSSLQAGGSGRVLTSALSGSASATKMYQALLVALRGHFDAPPSALNAFRDPRDTMLQLAFRSSIAGVKVTGLIGIATSGTKAKAVVLYDSSAAFAGSVGRLVGVAIGGGSAGANIALTRVAFPDGSGSIGLARGWTLKYASQGAADIAGPVAGSGMSIGANLTVPFTSSDPAQAIALMARAQYFGVRLTVIDSKPTPWQNGQAAFGRYRAVLNGSSMDYFGLFAITPFDGNQVFFYSSYLQAPTASFAAVLPAGLKIWGSWSVNPALFAARLSAAAQSMRETGELLQSANANRQRAFDGINAGWSEYIRDVATLENTAGNRQQVNAAFAARVVQDNPNGFRIVPPSELLPR